VSVPSARRGCNHRGRRQPIGVARRARVLLLALLAGCVGADRRRLEARWAVDVLLGAESGGKRTGVVRWTQPVTYLIVDADARVERAARDAGAELGEALDGFHRLSLAFVPRYDERIGQPGYVTVFPVAPRDAGSVALAYGVPTPAAEADGWFSIRWNQRWELQRAIVFVDPGLEIRWLRHTMLEEMFQVLGASNDSPLLQDSVVFEGRQSFGSRDRLARIDRDVLQALYGRLDPGADADAIRRAVAR